MRSTKLLLFILTALFIAAPVFAQSVVNGDFESGNSGFSSDYGYVVPETMRSARRHWRRRRLHVHNNPRLCHAGLRSFGDHTTGSGLMMIVNGAPDNTDSYGRAPSVRAWSSDSPTISPHGYETLMEALQPV